MHPRSVSCIAVQRSVEAYGAFVDIGAETDGLVHVSQLSVRRASRPMPWASCLTSAAMGWVTC